MYLEIQQQLVVAKSAEIVTETRDLDRVQTSTKPAVTVTQM